MQVSKSLLPYVLFALLDLIACATGNDSMRYVTKPLLMPALAFYFYRSVPVTPLNRYVFMALLLSFLGDTLLMFSSLSATFFILGLTSFLLAHLVYVVINMSAVNVAGQGLKPQWQDLPFLLYGFVIFAFLKGGLGDMYFPALAYTVVICIVGLTARKRWKRTDNQSFWLVMSGAIAFLLSDSLLAINKFLEPLPQPDLLVMSTYVLAQFLIIRGIIVFIQKIPREAGS